MTVATEQRVHLSESLQNLVDSRLDTIERMLLGRVARGERLAIVSEVESQIHELIGEREADDLTREDVLAVLARLDPPEAYLPEGNSTDSPPSVPGPIRPLVQALPPVNHRVATASAIVGLTALSLLLLLPLCYLLAMASSDVAVLFSFGTTLIQLVCGVMGIALGTYARKSGAWALVGVVSGIFAVIFSLLTFALLIQIL